jgi:type 1 glutamine amidotransferase
MDLFSGTTIRRVVAAAVALPLAGGATLVAAGPAAADEEDYKILVVGKTLGFRHSHIDDTTRALIELGEDNGFTVDVWDPPNDSAGWWGSGSPGQPDLTMGSTPFTSAEDLSQYATLVFVSPVDNTNSLNPATPRLLDDTELAALQGYIHAGGGFVGLHAATDTMHTVPWYSELTGGGARFVAHPQQQTATMRVESPAHPSTAHLPAAWERFDEWYNYSTNPREDVHVLLTLDESTYSPGNGAMGEDHPISWCQNFEGGRSWYEGAGHTDASWTDPLFREHVLAGVEWTAGVVEGGGNCVTFPEVDGVVAGLNTSAVGDGVIAGAISSLLGSARTAAEAGDPATAVQVLGGARSLVDHLSAAAGDRALLASKIDDLVVWQGALVDDGPAIDLAAEAELRTMGGKQYVAVRVLNEDDTPVDITLETSYGSKEYADVAPGKNAYQAFATRLVEAPSGEVTVTATTERDGETVTEELVLAYAGTP